jgi:hypothetical protein
MASDKSWKKIFEHTGMDSHDFDSAPYELSADQIKAACQEFTKTAEKTKRRLVIYFHRIYSAKCSNIWGQQYQSWEAVENQGMMGRPAA